MTHIDTDPGEESRPTLPGPLRVIIYSVGTPIAAACAFLGTAEGLDPFARLVVGAVGAAAIASVGTTALGNYRR